MTITAELFNFKDLLKHSFRNYCQAQVQVRLSLRLSLRLTQAHSGSYSVTLTL